ncbi:diguanylate cyclase [Coralloluteibacterium thermophilus]|uniref:diguanylate cyclase n=1 Tax=Coralloluteibacterium thermophilum TaxID=2707049 RepID=A0ABV9NHT2_9GAMM
MLGLAFRPRCAPRPARPPRWGPSFLCLLVLALVPGLATAAAPAAPPLRDYVVDRWTSREGLPHNSVRALAQTPDGYLWFATWEGLVRYDGLDFTVFDRSTADPALPDNGVGALYVDPAGALWFSDSRGNLGRRAADGSWRFWHSGGTWPGVLIHAMAMDDAGRLWLSFEGRGLGCLHPDGRFEYAEAPEGVPLALSFPRMAADADGRIWIGGMDGLMVREADGALRRAPESFRLPRGLAWPYRAPDGAIWIAAGDTLYRLRGDGIEPVHRVPGRGSLTALLQDRYGDLWLGTENRSLVRIGARGLERLPGGEVQPPGRIVNLLEDAEGSIWAGANGGLFRLRETLFTRLTQRDGLSGDYVRALLEDDAGDLWVGSAGGLDRVRADGRIEPLVLDAEVPPSVLSLARTGDGDLWVGAFGGRVFQVRGGRLLRQYDASDGLPRGHVRAIAAEPDGGAVWVATQLGPARIVDGRVERPLMGALPGGLITALAWIDGALWVGSVQGASVLRDGRVRSVPLADLSGARTVFGFQAIGDDVWIATDRGLYRDQGGVLARVGLEQGLPVDTVFQVVADGIGNAWISSNRGMLRARMDDLDAVADGRLARLPVDRYDETDGMSNAQGNGSSGPSLLRRRDGSVWMATAGGISVVDPERWLGVRGRPAPVPQIASVWADGQPLAWRDGQSLPGGVRIAVAYVGLSFLLPERIRFRTRIEGLDPDWIERGRQRSVDIIGLPPGEYTLRIAAAHPEGEWSAREAVWRFTVAPLWWQRRSVQAAGLFALALLLTALYRLRIRRYRAINDRLVKLVDERTAALQRQADRLRQADSDKNVLLDRLRSQAETFERQAREDVLTGLPNRRSFDEALARGVAAARRTQRPLGVLLLDVDRFKAINDAHSHAVGDEVLRQVGRLLAEACRGTDTAARIGGEEFALVLPDTGLDEVLAVAGRLRARFGAYRGWGGMDALRVTFSAGAAVLVAEDAAPADLMRRADEALYRAKVGGRDRICTA